MATDRQADLAELMEEVRRIEVLSRRLVTDILAGSYHSVFKGAGIEFEGVREYVDGDDPRKVDWNVTARMGRPFVKKYVDERELTVLFLFDLSASMDGGFGHWSSRGMAARVAACLAFAAVLNDDKVGLVAFGERVEEFVPPKKGHGHVLRIVRDCLALPGAQGTDLAQALEFVSGAVRRHAIVFVVSDFLTDGWREKLALCSRRHDVVAVRVLPPELAAPRAGLMRVRDPETGRATLVDWNSPRVRAAYADRVERWRESTREDLRRAKVDVMDVPTPTTGDINAVARPILRFFRMRALRGSKR